MVFWPLSGWDIQVDIQFEEIIIYNIWNMQEFVFFIKKCIELNKYTLFLLYIWMSYCNMHND